MNTTTKEATVPLKLNESHLPYLVPEGYHLCRYHLMAENLWMEDMAEYASMELHRNGIPVATVIAGQYGKKAVKQGTFPVNPGDMLNIYCTNIENDHDMEVILTGD